VTTRVMYSYVGSRRTDPSTGIMAPAAADITHGLTLVANRNFAGSITGGAAFRYASGRPFTPVVGATRSADGAAWTPQHGAPGSDRLPAFGRLDLSASWFRAAGPHLQLVGYVPVATPPTTRAVTTCGASSIAPFISAASSPCSTTEKSIMRTVSILAAVMLVIAMPLPAQPGAHASSAVSLADSARVMIETAVDRGDMAALEASIALLDRGLALHTNDPLLRHYRGYALYRAGSLIFGQAGAARARPYFDRAAETLEPLAREATIPETYAVLSSVHGMQIAASRVSMVAGMRLGPKASEQMTRAVETGPRNPRVWVLRGISAFNTPSAFGGGIDKAESYLKKAQELFAADSPAAGMPAWGRADAHVWLGQVYAKQGTRDAARAEYQAALALQPRHPWITGTLLPQLARPD
jgi:hypothetical protein